MSSPGRVAITGASGILGTALRPYFPQADFLSRASCDVANAGSVRNWFGHHTYDLVIHAAAETSAMADPATLMAVNVQGTANVLQWTRRQNARFVYISTDYVYEGRGKHTESDALQPHGPYAESKLGGELVARSYASSVVIRGSWYDRLMYTRAAQDAFTSKVPVARAAEMVATVSASTHTGIFNIGNGRRSLWEICVAEFQPQCYPIPRSQVQGIPYAIPADVSLDTTRYKETFGR